MTHLTTPYYRRIISFLKETEPTLPENNYTPYEVFCLTTRFKVSRPGAIARFLSMPLDDRMVLTVQLVDEATNSLIQLSEEDTSLYQQQIDQITSQHRQHCLLLSLDDSPNHPRSWVQAMLPYIELPEEYDSYLELNWGQGSLYVNLSGVEDYPSTYKNLYDMIRSRLDELYHQGAFITEPDFAERWGLHLLSAPNLYCPQWIYPEFIPDRIAFLYERELGLPVRLRVPDHPVSRHFLALYLNFPVTIINGSLVLPDTFKEWSQVFPLLSTITRALSHAEGKVVTSTQGPISTGVHPVSYQVDGDGLVYSALVPILSSQ